MTEREKALREAAAIAHMWVDTQASRENSTNLNFALAMATVTRYTAEKIEEAILGLIEVVDVEGGCGKTG